MVKEKKQKPSEHLKKITYTKVVLKKFNWQKKAIVSFTSGVKTEGKVRGI